MTIPQTHHPLLGDHPVCHCSNQLVAFDVITVEERGLVQVVPGKDAVEMVDVSYQCPACGLAHVRRFRRGGGEEVERDVEERPGDRLI